MKKICALVCLLAILLSASGCAYLTGMFSNLDTPVIQKVGNVISWTEVQDAKTYEILVNGESYDSTTETTYVFKEVTQDMNVSVIAYAENTHLKSEETQKLTIYKNSDFNTSETLEIELINNQEYSIPSSVKNLKLSGTAAGTSILVEERSTDLVITLDNVNLTSAEGKSCIQQMGDKNGSAIIVELVGDNHLAATAPTAVPDTPAQGSEAKGGTGYAGGHGIQYENIVFKGEGNVELLGAAGGKGGKGADQKKGILNVTQAGNGGNGGSGGSGFSCSNVVICTGVTAKISVAGGKGGQAGAHGAITVSITGGLASALGVVTDGAQGANGAACVYSACLKISGILHEN